MRQLFIGLSKATLLAGGLLAFSAHAGPVHSDEAEASDESVVTSTPASVAASSASTLAAEILKETEAAPTTDDAPRVTRGAAAPSPGSPQPPARTASGPTDDWPLRAATKSAVRWLKDIVPWLRDDDDERAARSAVATEAVDWSEVAREGGSLRATNRRSADMGGGTTVPHSLYEAPRQGTAYEAQRNLIGEALALVREIVTHPMTWLVVSLFVIGGIAIRMFDRRPK